MIGEKENCNYMGILETDTIKQVEKKKKKKVKERNSFSKPSSVLEISSKR